MQLALWITRDLSGGAQTAVRPQEGNSLPHQLYEAQALWGDGSSVHWWRTANLCQAVGMLLQASTSPWCPTNLSLSLPLIYPLHYLQGRPAARFFWPRNLGWGKKWEGDSNKIQQWELGLGLSSSALA